MHNQLANIAAVATLALALFGFSNAFAQQDAGAAPVAASTQPARETAPPQPQNAGSLFVGDSYGVVPPGKEWRAKPARTRAEVKADFLESIQRGQRVAVSSGS